MPSRAPVLFVASGYLLATALALLAFLGVRAGVSPSGWAISLCLAPIAVYLLVSWREQSRPQFLGKSAACLGFLPILTLMWAMSNADAAAPEARAAGAPEPSAVAQPAPSVLDEARLFSGAQAVQDVPLGQAAIERMRSGAFADGTEVSFLRFRGEAEAQAYLAFMRDAQQGSPAELAGRQGLRLALAPERYTYVELHGREIVQVRARDEAEALARLLAQGVPAPSSAPGVTASTTAASHAPSTFGTTAAPVWPFATAYSVAHALGFVLFILWAGTRTTRVPAAPSAELISPARLRARLLSLSALEVPFFVGGGERDDTLVATYHLDPNATRVLRVVLAIDPARPGPFSMSGPDLVSNMLKSAGYERITFERHDADICIGRDLDEAIEFAMALGPAGEIIRPHRRRRQTPQPAGEGSAQGDALPIRERTRRVGPLEHLVHHRA